MPSTYFCFRCSLALKHQINNYKFHSANWQVNFKTKNIYPLKRIYNYHNFIFFNTNLIIIRPMFHPAHVIDFICMCKVQVLKMTGSSVKAQLYWCTYAVWLNGLFVQTCWSGKKRFSEFYSANYNCGIERMTSDDTFVFILGINKSFWFFGNISIIITVSFD